MARSSFISHTVNGYSRYDVPESKAFSCTPGILYPVRIDFINARDRVSIAQGIDVRSNPLAVPSFNPYTVRLHRFWVPLQLYHPEMRTNSSKFDMNVLSQNWIPCTASAPTSGIGYSEEGVVFPYTNSLMNWLRIANRYVYGGTFAGAGQSPELSTTGINTANADTYLAYWDIVRNYYSYSQWGIYSFAWPASWYLMGVAAVGNFAYNTRESFFTQRYGNLEYLDAFYESQFYPGSVSSITQQFNRSNLFSQILSSDLGILSSADSNGFPVASGTVNIGSYTGPTQPLGQFSIKGSGDSQSRVFDVFILAHPMAVVPSNPDRFSRTLPPGDSGSEVSMTSIRTIPQLAVASRLQEYKDLLGAGGNRYSDWLETFFASKIEHVDRPKLLFSASQTVNVQVVMNQSGNNMFNDASPGYPSTFLGQQGGSICFNTQLGRKQSYYFREPGYLIDMLSIRPVYYWTGIRPDYLDYRGADYFNPIYNDIGYQDIPAWRVLVNPGEEFSNTTYAREPCFNEFRSSYDEVLGQLQSYNSRIGQVGYFVPLYSYWVQQRAFDGTLVDGSANALWYRTLFVDMSQVNSLFASHTEDNFFVNLSYAVWKKSLVNKTFATRLSNR